MVGILIRKVQHGRNVDYDSKILHVLKGIERIEDRIKSLENHLEHLKKLNRVR